MLLLIIVLATLAAGIGSVWLAALLGFAMMGRYAQHLLSLAAGALLATAFMHLLPEAFEGGAAAQPLFVALLVGLVFFFLLDKAELWHHGHEHHHGGAVEHAESQAQHDHAHEPADGHGHAHAHPHSHAPRHHHHHRPASGGSWAILTGDSVHCFGDGILIASAFIADVRLGVAAALAVLAHEIPHHMGDLAVLRQSSGDRRAAVLKVSLAGAITPLGGLVGYFLVDALHEYLPYFLVIASSSFIYVALADLIPQLQRRLDARATAAQVAWLLAGILLVWGASSLAHSHGGHEHGQGFSHPPHIGHTEGDGHRH
ncbi:MAG: ZIP family metal transporter [Burkholderiaceae bacterium]|nr:ZIP family metal transporter [Burkholderiaceae bacterium]